MRNVILALTNSADGKHSEVVISKLIEKGEKVFRFDSDRFATGETTITFSPSAAPGKFLITSGKESLQSCNIKSVWYRRPNHFNLSIADPIQKDYAEREIRSFLENVWSGLESEKCISFLSQPSQIEKARKKLSQLTLALQYGMRIPKTIVTNNPKEALTFHKTCHDGMIFKAVNNEFLNYGKKSYNIPTTLINTKHLENINLIKKNPVIFQELIQKNHELRVTVVGKKIFPIKIDSQKNPLTVVDWRNPLCIDKLDHKVTTIDSKTEAFCFKMLRVLGLRFGAFDFIVDKTGKLYFLEVNPNGQWYWLEDMTGVLISDAIADILKVF